MNIFIIMTCIVSSLNLLFLIAMAGSMSKLISAMRSEPVQPSVNENVMDMTKSTTYDESVMRGESNPFSDGLNQRPARRNWDGVSSNNS